MKIGIFSPTFSDLSLEEVCRKASELGYETVELPGFRDGNNHLDVEDILKGNNAAKLKSTIASYGMTISAISNHTESLLILGPYDKDTAWIHPGTKEERIAYGTERMILNAQAANALALMTSAAAKDNAVLVLMTIPSLRGCCENLRAEGRRVSTGSDISRRSCSGAGALARSARCSFRRSAFSLARVMNRYSSI